MTTFAFHRLPADVQRFISTFLPLWQRLGLEGPSPYRGDPDAYYRSIRHCPRGFKKDILMTPTTFHYRHRTHVFQWKLLVNVFSTPLYHQNNFTFIVQMCPQWNDDRYSLISQLLHLSFHEAVQIPPGATLIGVSASRIHQYTCPVPQFVLNLDFCVLRDTDRSTPTLQACVDGFAEYMRQLAHRAEFLRKRFGLQ